MVGAAGVEGGLGVGVEGGGGGAAEAGAAMRRAAVRGARSRSAVRMARGGPPGAVGHSTAMTLTIWLK